MQIHPPKDPRAVELRDAEQHVQDGRHDLEDQRPLLPQGAEEGHDDDGLDDGGCGFSDGEGAHDLCVALVVGWVLAVDEHCDVGVELCGDVEGACLGGMLACFALGG